MQFRIFSPFTLHHSPLNCVEAEFFIWDFVGGDELINGVEDDLEVLIVFFLKFFDFFSEELVGLHQRAELNESAHDGDVDLDGSGRTKHGGKHGNALFGEGVGEVFSVLSAFAV